MARWFDRIGLSLSSRLSAIAEAAQREVDRMKLGEDPSLPDPATEALASADAALSTGGWSHAGQLLDDESAIEPDGQREVPGVWLPMTSERWSRAWDIRREVDSRHPRLTPEGSINATHVAAESSARTRAGLPSYIAALDGPGNFRPADPSLLDGATEPAPPGQSPDVGQFAAAWNALTPAEREEMLLIWDERDRRAYDCFVGNHDSIRQALDSSRAAHVAALQENNDLDRKAAQLAEQLGGAKLALDEAIARGDILQATVGQLRSYIAVLGGDSGGEPVPSPEPGLREKLLRAQAMQTRRSSTNDAPMGGD